MVKPCSEKYDSVVQTHLGHLPIECWPDDVHDLLECSESSAESEWQEAAPVYSVIGGGCNLFTVNLLYLYLPVASMVVQSRELLRIFSWINHGCILAYGVGAAFCHFIFPIVITETNWAVFLWCTCNWRDSFGFCGLSYLHIHPFLNWQFFVKLSCSLCCSAQGHCPGFYWPCVKFLLFLRCRSALNGCPILFQTNP